MKSKSAMAFIGLVIIQVGIGLIYKLAAAGSSGYAFSQASALAMSEAFKLGMSSLFYYQSLQESNKLLPSLFSQFLSEVPPKVRNGMILLSVLYLVNNHVFFYLVTYVFLSFNVILDNIYSLADPGTINLVKSSSTFLTATILWTFVNRVPTKIQWFSIAFQSLGLITSQYDECKGSSSYSFFVYLLIFLNTAISAVCGSYNDYLTKASSASLHALNMWLYVFGFVLNTAFYFFLSIINPEQPGFFEGYNGWGFFVVVCNSVIGLAITAVYKVHFFSRITFND